ncbi:cytochrome b [Chromobacterium subtsugae]|uniref:Cytochrome b n=1 Tax=Chromobacterium subtsugae TaxID=251747 RepID=A0ABS7FBI5_9NEIS|nr:MULTISPECIES: cytochrome b [Chromobacterium]KUM03381.1 cytochrome B [Chromobacterium subtsugae]KZE85897.1 cytochrome B [Chromobacterium sp. F49]MBW7567267.1 cytochrome b [Chromobacterium subtsugae]MBW8287433.1 cytochrome b [Chromobacterium subtsugae]OBU85203.1 cytochrome B561 [Chromobacterium subtsugae]
MLRNSSQSYGRVARALHWLCALAVIAALVFIELKGNFPKGDPVRGGLSYAHIQAGLIVLLLVVPRLAWRLGNPPPGITPRPSPLMKLLAHAGHWALYALMLALPILGIAFIQARGGEVALFGLALPAMLAPDPAFGRQLKDAHELLGNVLLWLSILHAAAAVWHHRFVKDDTLTRLIGPLR